MTNVMLHVDGAGETLDPEVESVLAWAVREGATNVIRHSGASRARIRIRAGASNSEVEVLDDGRGAAGSNGGPAPGGHGLAGLVERAQRWAAPWSPQPPPTAAAGCG